MFRNPRTPPTTVLIPLVLVAGACAHGGAPEEPNAPVAAETPPAAPSETPEREPRDPASVTSEEFLPTDDVDDVLRGRVAGVYVTRVAGGIIVHIRGTSSIQGERQPLYVIDGVPVEAAPDGSVPVQPYDIESIRVLKNAVDTSMYGVRGANGVIVITTKRPPD